MYSFSCHLILTCNGTTPAHRCRLAAPGGGCCATAALRFCTPSHFAADVTKDQLAALVGHHELAERRHVFGEPGPQHGFERQQACARKRFHALMVAW